MKWLTLNQDSARVPGCRGVVKMLLAVAVTMQLVACGGSGGGSSSVGGTSPTADVSGGSSTPVGGTTSIADATSSGSGGATTSSAGGGATNTNALGSLELSWVAPVSRTDGTPLSLAEIDGFRIYYGSSAGNYTHSVDITDGTAQRVIVNNLPSGTYYIVMTTYDVDGRESGYSVVVMKTVS